MIRRGIGVQNYVSAGVSTDADAQAFIDAAGITDATQQSAINTLVTDLKGYGIWTKMKAIYPFVGGTSSTHKWNLKDPRDLDAAFRLVFSGGMTHSLNGVLFGGVNGYGDTKLNISTVYSNTNSVSLSVYSRTNNTDNAHDIGAYDTSPQVEFSIRMRRLDLNMSTNIGFYNTQFCNFVVANSLGFGLSSRTSSSSLKLYKNGSLLNQSNVNATPTAINRIIAIGAANTNNPISLIGYSSREYAFASIGDGLTDTEAANLYTAVQAYQTTLSRNV